MALRGINISPHVHYVIAVDLIQVWRKPVSVSWLSRKPIYWVSPNIIRFLRCIVGLIHLDYSIDSRNSCMYMLHQMGSDFCEVEGRRWRRQWWRRQWWRRQWWRRRRLSSEITTSKSAIVHLVCVIIMYTIYEMYKDVASPRSSYTIFLKCWGSWWHEEVSQ